MSEDRFGRIKQAIEENDGAPWPIVVEDCRWLVSEYERLERTMKFWEKGYLAEHNNTWGECIHRKRVERLQKENDQLRPFVLAILKNFGSDENMDLDYCKFQDLATQFKVIRWEKYDPKKHGEQYDIEEDDEVWLPDIVSTPHSAGRRTQEDK